MRNFIRILIMVQMLVLFCFANAYAEEKPWPSMPQTINFTDQEKYDLLYTYAPRVWLHLTELYFPSSVEWAFPYMRRYLNADGKYWLHTIEEMAEPSTPDLAVFYGDLASAPVYAYFINKQIPATGATLEVVDLVYFFYYPYNRGKEVFNTMFGNHVGDWEHITVRLTWQYGDTGWEFGPHQVYYPAHSFGYTYNWTDPELGKVLDTHPVVYSAWGSHGSWSSAGSHVYDEICHLFCEDLTDHCSEGSNWDTWTRIEAFEYFPATNTGVGLSGNDWPVWMSNAFSDPGCDTGLNPGCDTDPAVGPIYRWGNPEWGRVFGQCRLCDGPTGPISKGVMTSDTLQ